MKANLLEQKRSIHFVGIGGIGMSALAGILLHQGKRLTGSDKEASVLIDQLRAAGVKTHIGVCPLPEQTQLLVASLAIPTDHPELKEARKKKIPILTYPQAVGELTRKYYTIAICGTHGKSTITAMIAKMLIENNFDPTVIVGTKLKELGGKNFRIGARSKILVLEACEYMHAFLNYSPRVVILHTLDPDHLDYYKNFDDYLDAFRSFVKKIPADGYFLGNLDDDDVHEILQYLQSHKFPTHNTLTYSTKYSSSDFFLHDNKIIQRNARVGELDLKIPGFHNRTNALAAFSLGSLLGIAPSDILQSLNRYDGAFRRFELKGKIGKTLLIDDYAHHPAEIEATLQAARERFPKEKICVVFQPHQYNRTKNLLKDFAESFTRADTVVIPNIYRVRDTEKDASSITPQRFVDEIRKNHPSSANNIRYGEGLESTTEFLAKNASKFDVIFTMGAGDVWRIAENLLRGHRAH